MTSKTAKGQKRNEFVFVIAGKEQTLVNAQCTELIDKLIPPEERTTGLWSADADKVTISDVLDEVRTLPFLSKRRVVVLRNADKFISARGEEKEAGEQEEQDERGEREGPSNREILEKYFDSPCPTGVLVMTVSKWQSNTKLAKKLPEIGTLITAEAPKGKQIRQRLIAYAYDAYGKKLDYGAAEMLVELAGDDITRLYTEIDKLAAYASNDKNITVAHVEALVGHNRLFDAFKVIDACLQKKTGEAIDRLRRMFADDKAAEYTTVGAFAYHFRNLFTAKKLLAEGHSQYEAGNKARIWYNKDVQFALLRRLSIKQIGDQIRQLAETDYAIKTGQAQPRIAIEQFVLKMAAL